MKRCLYLLLTGLLPGMAAAVPAAELPPRMIYQHPPQQRVQPLDYPQFRQLDAELRNIVRRHGDHRDHNRFCAVGYRLDSGLLETVLVWDNAQWLIRWWGGDALAASDERHALSASFAPVTDLRRDLVEDRRFPLGTRAVVRADAEALIADCRQFGRQYTVPPLPASNGDDDD